MDKIIEFIEKVNNFLLPFWNKIHDFFGKEWVLIYVCIFLLLLIIFISGVIRIFSKHPKFIIIVFFILLAISLALYFIYYKSHSAGFINMLSNLISK